MVVRNRFIHAPTFDVAIDRMNLQSERCLELVALVNAFPYTYTNAGCVAEAAAHWAFCAYPELRVEDKY